MIAEIRTKEDLRTAIGQARPPILELQAKHPSEWTFDFVAKQLDYIESLVVGGNVDPGLKADLNLGFLGMRFVREFDRELGELLSDISHFVEENL